LGRAVGPLVEQMVHHHRAARALPKQMPGLRQFQRLGLGEQRLHHLLVHRKIIDAGPRAAGQAVARQVAGDHHKTLVQRPVHHVAVQAHVVVEAVKHKHRRHRLWGRPHLPHHLEPAHLKAPQAAHSRHFARGQVQSIKALVHPRFGAERLRIHQGSQAVAQMIGVKGNGHKGFQT